MLQLIKKDIMIHKLSWLLYLGMLVFFMLFHKDIIFVIALMSAIVIMNTFYFEEDANGHKLWNSLPFTRNEIVHARYISMLIFTCIMTVVTVLVQFGLAGSLDSSLWKELFGGIFMILLAGGICIPLFYSFGQQRIVLFLFVLFMLLIIFGVHAFYYVYEFFIGGFSSPLVPADMIVISIGTVVAIACYLLSWILSIRIYQAKEII